MAQDTIVRVSLAVSGGPAALAELKAFRAAVADAGNAQGTVKLGVDSTQVVAAKQDVTALGAAHQALGAKPTTIGMDISQVTAARSAVQGLDGDIGALAGSLAKLSAPAAFLAIGASATKLAADFQTMSTTIQNNTTATAADIAGMNQEIKQLSAESGASLTELAGGWTHAFNIMGNGADAAKVLEVAMQSAVSTGSDVSRTTDALAKTIHQFGQSSKEAAADMDILHLAAAMGNTSLEQFIDASAKSMVTAASLGVSLKDVSSAYVALTRAGFDAGEANTQIAALLTHLITPSKEAKAAIADLSHATGIDLSSDFSLAGIQAKGLVGVLGDIRAATNGQEDAVLKLIPAQRGGIGALALTTNAYKDATDASTEFNRVVSGQLTPTADAYARTQATFGNQAAVMAQQFKQLGVELGSVAVGPLTNVLKAINSLPEAVKQGAAEIGLLAVGVKALGVAIEFGTGLFGAHAASVVTDTEAIAANTTAVEANAVARRAGAGTGLIGTAVGIGAAAIAAQTIDQNLFLPAAARDAMKQYDTQFKSAEEAKAALAKMEEANKNASFFGIPNPDIPGVGRIFPTGLSIGGHRIGGDTYSEGEIQGLKDWIALKEKETAVTQDAAQAKQEDAKTLAAYNYDPVTVDANAAISAMEVRADREKQAAAARDLGASESDIQRSIFGVLSDGAAATNDQIRLSTQRIAELRQAQKEADAAVTEGAAKATAAADAAHKQRLADIVSAAQAAQSAISAISFGTSGIAGLADAAQSLDDVRAKLADLGQGSPHLNALSALADQFKTIADAENTAATASNAFNLTLTETNKSIAALGSLKSEYLSALDAAEKRQAQGTASQSDLDIINARSSVLTNIGQTTGQLQQRANQDILGKLQHLPDYVKADDTLRSMIAQFPGGAKQLFLDVQTNADKAAAEIKAIEDATHKTTLAVTVQYQTPDGTAISWDQVGNPGGAADGGYARPRSTAVTGGGPYGTGTLYQPGEGGGLPAPGGTAQKISQYWDAIQQAANQDKIDPYLLAAIIMHESGGTPGIQNLGGAPAYGLTQVYTPAHPNEDMAKLTGTSFQDAVYQIDAGAKILAGHIAAAGGSVVKGVQNYGGYTSGTGYYDELQKIIAGFGVSGGTNADGATGGGAVAQAANQTGIAVVQKALQHVGEFDWDNWCEQFAEDMIQKVTGSRGPGAGAKSATAAFQQLAREGLQVTRAQAQPGDLVYYPSAAGGVGHVAIYMGGGKEVGSLDATHSGVQVDPVMAGAQYIRMPYNVGVTGGAPASRAASWYGPGTYTSTGGTAAAPVAVGTVDATRGSVQRATVSAADLQEALAGANAELAKLDNPSIKAAQQSLANILPTLTQMQEKAAQIGDTPLTSTEQQQAAAAAWQQGLQYEQAYATLLNDIINHTGDLAADTQKVADVVGGPMAEAYAQAARASATIAATTVETTRLTKEHDAVVKQRAADDQASSRAATMAGWAQQDAQAAMQRRQQAAQNALQDQQTAENARYTQVQRDEQDRQRQLAFSQQVGATDLQNQLQDVQKRQQTTGYQRTAQEQLVSANVGAAGTNAQAAAIAAQLAALHERDLKQKDADTKEIDAIQEKIRLQAKQAAVDSYNLETETIREQRKHEDIMAGLAAQGTAQQRTFAAEQQAESEHQQAIQRSTQLQQWQEQDQRQAEDTAYQAALDAQKAIADSAQASLDAANQAITAWQQTGQVIASAAAGATQAASLLQSQPLANYPNTGAISRLGGHAAGGIIPLTEPYSVVGERGPEIISAPGYTVTPAQQTAALLGGNTFNIGVTVNAGGDDDAVVAEAMRRFETRLRSALRAGRDARKARGG